MALAAGTRLGPYEILTMIGAGGMGEVYRARDTRLKREVALKVLPDSFASDRERMARFQREAEILASLNHPNIAQIYGVEDRALAMELVEGESLSGTLSLDTALTYAKQIAEALEAAHEKGIVHRDLKPANIKITPQGVVKVLDFGLAAVAQPSPDPTGDPSASPTLTMSPTRVGMILGTAAYMSPEQARGKPVDKRADIWAFGCVFYEMLTGRPAFTGETITDVLASVVTSEPDWNTVPQKVQALLRRCLEKDPDRRLRDIGDFELLLDENPLRTPRGNKLPWALAAALAIVAAGATGVAWRATRPHPLALQPLMRLDVNLGQDVSLGSVLGSDVILSPDGTRMVYVSQSHLFTRRLDQPSATELVGTEGAFAPFFSPDGQWVAFIAQGKLKKISVDGGVAVPLCDVSSAFGGSWGEDGYIVAASTTVLSKVASSGGTLTPLTELDPQLQEVTHRWPQVLPGNKAFLFTAHNYVSGFDAASIKVFSFADRRAKTLLRGGTYGRYLPSGHLVYVSQGALFAVPFDLDRLEVRGARVQMLDQVAYSPQYGFAQFDFSRNGTLAYRKGGPAGNLATIQWLDSGGSTQPLFGRPGRYSRFRFSPDGKQLALNVAQTTSQDIWIYDLQRDRLNPLTFGLTAIVPVWTADGRYIVFQGVGGIYWTRSDGTGSPQLLISGLQNLIPQSFTSDGKRLAFTSINTGTGFDISTVPVESDGTGLRAGKPEVFLQTRFDEVHPSFSPDGRWIAYDSNELGRPQVYVRAFPDKGGRWPVTTEGGLEPLWSRNGRELFFHTEDNRIMVASYAVKGESFVPEKPRLWSEKRTISVGTALPTYDLTPDGKRVAVLMPVEGQEAPQAQNHVTFLLNFFDELRRRAPVIK